MFQTRAITKGLTSYSIRIINTVTLEWIVNKNLSSLIEDRVRILNQLNTIEHEYDLLLEQFSNNPSTEQKILLKPKKDYLYNLYVTTIERLENATASLANYSPAIPSTTKMDNVRHA